MLCRALLAAAVFTYVLCVLLLSGVQKEDIDASTLRKLRRHNVNIDAINDQQLKKECLGKTDIPVTVTTPVTKPTTKKTEIPTTEKNVLTTEDTPPLQKIFEYLDFLHKEEKRKTLESKAKTNKLKVEEEPLSFISSQPIREIIQGINVEDPSIESPSPKTTKKNNEKNKIESNINSDLETLMKVLRANNDKMPDLSQQRSTTIKTIRNIPVSEHAIDVDYITKIVEEIMSKRQLKNVNTTKGSDFNSNGTLRNVEENPEIQFKNKPMSLINYYLNNCKLKNFYVSNDGDKKTDILDNIKRLINVPDASGYNEYFICNKLKQHEQKVVSEQNGNYIINNILSELQNEREKFKLLDNESPIGTIKEHQPSTTLKHQKNNNVKVTNANNGKERLNIVDESYLRALGNLSKNISFDGVTGNINISDVYKDGILQDTETNQALKNVLQSQSTLFNQIFNQQRNLIKLYNTDKGKINNKRPEPKQSELKSQPNRVYNEQEDPTVTIQQLQQNDPGYIDENIYKIEPKFDLEQDKQEQDIGQPSLFYYKPSKSDNNVINEEYRMPTPTNHFVTESQASKPAINILTRNRMDDKLKTTNPLNNVHSSTDIAKEYERPWFFAEDSNKLFELKTDRNQKGSPFTPNSDTNKVVDSRLKYSYEKSWSPYFDTYTDNNITQDIRSSEDLKAYNIYTHKQVLPINSVKPLLIRSFVRELVPDSKKYPVTPGTYENENKHFSVIEDRSSEQLESKKGTKSNKYNCRTIQETRIECLHNTDYKNIRVYLRDQQNNMQTNSRENNDEVENHSNNIITKHILPSKTKITKRKQRLGSGTTSDQVKITTDDDEFISQNETIKSKITTSFPPNVIKDIAQSIKDYVLRELRTTTTSTISTSTSTSQTKTTTSRSTTTSTTTVKSTTTEKKPSTTTKGQIKIQDAAKTLEKMMKMLEKMTMMKEELKPENVKLIPDNINKNVTTQKTIKQRQEQPTDSENQQNILLEQNRVPQVSQPVVQQHVVNPKPYMPQQEETKAYNLLPFSQSLQRNPYNLVPHIAQVLQSNAENRLVYDSQKNNLNTNDQVQCDTHPLQQSPVNRLPYELPKRSPEHPENIDPYVPQVEQLKEENRLRYYPNPENAGYVPQAPVNNIPNAPKVNPTYVPQAVQLKAESGLTFDSQLLQNNQQNPQLDTQSLQRNPGDNIPLPDINAEGVRYFPLALQPKMENRNPYDLQRLQYLPHAAEIPPGNSHNLYKPTPMQNGSKNRPYDYSMMDKYHHTNIEYVTDLKDVQERNKEKPASGKQIITVQTNSAEISPLKIVLQKPFLQNVVLTTQAPVKVYHHDDDDPFDFKKPVQKQHPHQVEMKAREMNHNNEANDLPRHPQMGTSREARKTKKERGVIQYHKSRYHNEIENFHEKLERGDNSWRHSDKEKIEKRVQRPIVKNTHYDDTHFRNFLQTQQKVNDMLERLLAGKNKPMSSGQVL